MYVVTNIIRIRKYIKKEGSSTLHFNKRYVNVAAVISQFFFHIGQKVGIKYTF